MADAQLGSVGNFNLGGYIPAAPVRTPLWQQAVAQILGNLAGQAGGAVIDRATTPDMEAYLKAQGVEGAPTAHGLHRGANAQEAAALVNTQTQKTGTEAATRQGDAKVGIESQRAATEKTQGEERLGIQRGQVAAEIARDTGNREIASKQLEQDLQRIDILRQQVDNAKTAAEREANLRAYQIANEVFRTVHGVTTDEALARSKIGLEGAMGEFYKGAKADQAQGAANINQARANQILEAQKFLQSLQSGKPIR
jgi:hypothetical protein